MKKIESLIQIVKFGLVGVLNTVVDFAVLNFLMWSFDIYSGKWLILLNITSFSLAVVNSYLWNRFWTFKIKRRQEVPEEFAKFISISLVGVVINSSIVYGVTKFIDPIFGLSPEIWANVAKVLATGLAMVWNFVGYKFWAFKKDDKAPEMVNK